ncbi:MAG: hypothetical protein HOJ35_06590 [Bdellovibrionales bacterium]|jgi:hypothetical protein|nr:hypothetical protein [Bdellovibrionales bacterium]
MKNIFVLFILLSTGANARELNDKESLITITLHRTLEVKQYFQENIDVNQYNWQEYLEYRTLKASCIPLELLLKFIYESDDLEDKSKELATLYYACSEGTLSLAQLFRLQQ